MNNNPGQSYGQGQGLNRGNTLGMNPQGNYGNYNLPPNQNYAPQSLPPNQNYPPQNPMPNPNYPPQNPMPNVSLNSGYPGMNPPAQPYMPISGNVPIPGVTVPTYGQPSTNQPGYGMNPYPPNQINSSQNYYPQPQPYPPMMPIGNPNIMLRNLLTQYSDGIFQKYDSNRSGYLDVKEIYPAVSELFGLCSISPPSYTDVLKIMRSFDNDGNGLIDMNEFRKIMLMMNGFQ